MSKELWEKSYTAWLEHTKNDIYREHMLIPKTIDALGDVSKKSIIDIGCGTGDYSLRLASAGANVLGIDSSQSAIDIAKKKSRLNGSLKFLKMDAHQLSSIYDLSFDIALCAMSFMDFEDIDLVTDELCKVLKPNGNLFISIRHPCFKSMGSRWEKSDNIDFFVIENYFGQQFWTEKVSGIDFPFRHKTLSEYLNTIISRGFRLRWIDEPKPSKLPSNISPLFKNEEKIPKFLFMNFTFEK